MKLVYVLILLAVGTISQNARSAQDVQLSQYYWENRVLITTVSSEQALASLAERLKKIWPEFEERKLIVFAIFNDRIYQLRPQSFPAKQNLQELTRRLNNKHTLLIGLDGQSKAIYDSFDSQQIFADIDAMPMRQTTRKN